MKRMLLFATLALTLLVGRCSTDTSVAGTKSGSETTNGLTAAVVYPDGNPAAGVLITVYRIIDDSGMYYPPIDSGLTNAAGEAAFYNITADSCFVASSTVDSSFMAFTRQVVFDSVTGDTVKVMQTLRASGTITGVVDIATQQHLSVRIAQTPFAVAGAPGARYSFRLPSDTFIVQSVVRGAQASPSAIVAASTAVVFSATSTSIDTMRLSRPFGGTGISLFDDFEDGDFINNLGLWWWTFSDSAVGGNSQNISRIGVGNQPDTPGAAGTLYDVRMQYTFGTQVPTFVGLGSYTRVNPDGTRGSIDLSDAQALTFYAATTALSFSVNLKSAIAGLDISAVIAPLDSLTHFYRIPFDSLGLASNTPSSTQAEQLRFVKELNFIPNPRTFGESGTIRIDEIKLEN